jgi:hypothetical protein
MTTKLQDREAAHDYRKGPDALCQLSSSQLEPLLTPALPLYPILCLHPLHTHNAKHILP